MQCKIFKRKDWVITEVFNTFLIFFRKPLSVTCSVLMWVLFLAFHALVVGNQEIFERSVFMKFTTIKI